MGRRGLILGAAALATVVASGAIIAGSRAGVLPTLPGWATLLDLPSGYDPYGGDDPFADESFVPPMEAHDLYAAFADPPADARSYGEAVTTATEPGGNVSLPSGRLVATDMFDPGGRPYDPVAPAGSHPVTILTVDYPAEPHRTIGAAMVRVGEGVPTDWRSDFGGDDPFGGVDGLQLVDTSAAFMSVEAIEAVRDPDVKERFRRAVREAISVDGDLAAEIAIDGAPGMTVVAFQPWEGSFYSTHVGLDGDGRPIVYLMDFGLLDAP